MKLLRYGLLLAAAVALAGCASHDKVVFATHTSYGVDVSGTAAVPDHVSLSYSRREIAIVPRKTNGDAHSVLGGMDSDVHWWNGSLISQTFATGEAARIAAARTRDDASTQALSSASTNTASLIFFTGTTFGLHLSAGDGQLQPNMLLGYRRSEAAYVPVPDPGQEVRSVYADIHINTTDGKTTDGATRVSQVDGVRIRQSFATGSAAEILVARGEAQEKLERAAGMSPSDLADVAIEDGAIVRTVAAMPDARRMELFTWAATTFPSESDGILTASSTLSQFENGFLPKLDADGRRSLQVRIQQLEAVQ